MTNKVGLIHVRTGEYTEVDPDVARAWVLRGACVYPEAADVVDRPAHYQVAPGVEVIQLTRHMDFLTGNVIKYVARAGKKPGNSKLQDLKKAQVYLRMLIEDAASEDAAQWTPDNEEN